ncbi:hypothetical protein JD969_02400 [Planctomycetota bacterium]|nr:hypothetical protein JD969_02400 [Planctomycetota bacterium]
MNWFTRLCRNTGLMIHHVAKPVEEQSKKQTISKTVEEKQAGPNVTLRRTTIEEIEIKGENQSDENK